MHLFRHFILFNIFIGFFVLFSQAQLKIVRGFVKADGSPLIGATIKVLANATTAVTDSNGIFDISLNTGAHSLSITAAEHNKKIVRVEVKENNPPLEIELTQTKNDLNEVVVSEIGRASCRERVCSTV